MLWSYFLFLSWEKSFCLMRSFDQLHRFLRLFLDHQHRRQSPAHISHWTSFDENCLDSFIPIDTIVKLCESFDATRCRLFVLLVEMFKNDPQIDVQIDVERRSNRKESFLSIKKFDWSTKSFTRRHSKWFFWLSLIAQGSCGKEIRWREYRSFYSSLMSERRWLSFKIHQQSFTRVDFFVDDHSN
jgi:hypothetical protein